MLIYVSPVPDMMAWEVDMLSISWDNLTVYAFSSTTLLEKVLQKLQHHPCKMILLAPLWPKQRWFLTLLEMLVDYLLELPQ